MVSVLRWATLIPLSLALLEGAGLRASALPVEALIRGEVGQGSSSQAPQRPLNLDVLTGKVPSAAAGAQRPVPMDLALTRPEVQALAEGRDLAPGAPLTPRDLLAGPGPAPARESPLPLRFNPYRAVFEVPVDYSNRELPSPEEVNAIQARLRQARPQAPIAQSRQRSVYPGVTISNPSGYGADKGRLFAGASYQSRTRFSGGPNPGKIFGGGKRDGTLGFGVGFGDAQKNVGFQVSYIAASFGGSRAPFSGGFNAKLHKQFGNGWAAALGGEGLLNFGRLPDGGNAVEFNDFENTYYASLTRSILLNGDISKPFSRLTLTGGIGSGRFRSQRKIENGEPGLGIFGSAALQVIPSTSFITEWTGQDLAMGLSVAPFRDFPLIISPAIRDIAGAGDGDPRFILGVGGSSSLVELGSLLLGAGQSSSLLQFSSIFADAR